jgi:hypothetical protein
MSRKKLRRAKASATASPPALPSDRSLPVLFAVTMFVSALLLFWVQPMMAKMVLPLLGGTPAVWNTCMVFFQAALLAGYAYVHVSTAWLGVHRQLLFHLALLAVPFLALPIGVTKDWVPPSEDNPIPWLLALLFVSVGFPFFVLSTTAPLLQKWFACTGHPSAKDPYFLYSASNLGSMLALLGYPVLLEPFLPLRPDSWVSQSWLWAVGYVVLVMLIVCCAWVVRLSLDESTAREDDNGRAPAPDSQPDAPVPLRSRLLTRLRWVALASVPSSLMMGVTTYMSLDLAAIPLFWVIPLALYLLSFILVFAKWPDRLHQGMVRALPVTLLLLVFLMQREVQLPIGIAILFHLLTLLVVALVCHGELARNRPPARQLTEFYLWMSLGGVLGGLFNALLAPLLFSGVAEYPIALVGACLLLPRRAPHRLGWLSRRAPSWLAKPLAVLVDVVLALLPGLAALGPFLFLAARTKSTPWVVSLRDTLSTGLGGLGNWLNNIPVSTQTLLAYGLAVVLCYLYKSRPLRFGLAVGAFVLGSTFWQQFLKGPLVHQERSFFGVLKVQATKGDQFTYYRLVNGTTLHGMQDVDPKRRKEPLTYYHPTGPIGQIFKAFPESQAKKNVAVIGLGTGTLAAYGLPGQQFTFYEIDPAVIRIALKHFAYLADCRAECRYFLGDARIGLEMAPDHQYQLMVVDAFSSDSIPIHLITREAVQLYFQKLTDDGLLAVHVSNRYLDLEPVLGNLAQKLGLVGLFQADDDTAGHPGKQPSLWAVLARRPEHLGSLATNSRWRMIGTSPEVGEWTDDFSNLLRVFRWME